ncbi:hypothetical protein Sjap_011290 [Stephania japonica]|uniref:Uncharacterized protein n=1 Tax=Stephania japonica TaxID=461633 RepID=A0AAP0JD90_9MAGN
MWVIGDDGTVLKSPQLTAERQWCRMVCVYLIFHFPSHLAELWWCPAVMRMIRNDAWRLIEAPMVPGRHPTCITGIGLSVCVVVPYSSYVCYCAARRKTTVSGGAVADPPLLEHYQGLHQSLA